MARVNSTLDPQPRNPVDQRLEELGAVASISGKPLRVRVQPDIYNSENGNYSVWAGLSWTVDLDGVEEGRKLREGLTDFFQLFGTSPQSQEAVLLNLRAMAEAREPEDPRRV